MEETNNLNIYGLEFQARSLCSQLAESNEVRFLLATQSLKPNNQIHLVKVDDDLKLQAKVRKKSKKAASHFNCWFLRFSTTILAKFGS